MAMMISKFHRLIQSRLLWIVFLIVIVFSFVIWGMITPKGANQRAASSPGKLYGKDVPDEEFRHAFFNTYVSLVMVMGSQINITDEIKKELDASAWRRLVALRKARELGLTVTDREVVGAIETHPGFVVNGRFSPVHYNHFVENILPRMGLDQRGFEEHVREEIALQKLRHLLDQAVLISPFEITRTFATLSDTFDIEYTRLTADDVRDKVEMTDADVREYFEGDPEAFTIPEKAKVDYVVFPVADYIEKAEIPEGAALAYYGEHPDDYTETVPMTNIVQEADEDGNLLDKEEVVEEDLLRPFEDVEEEITALLQKNVARSLALDEATDLILAAIPKRASDTPRAFEDVAREFDKTVHEDLPPFSRYEPVDGIDAGPDFNEAAFRLRPNPEERISEAIRGEDHVYVLKLVEKIDARVPDFSEVENDVREVAKAHALEQTLVETGQELREAAIEAAENGGSFADTVAGYGLAVSVATNISAVTGIEDSDYSDLLLRAILVRNQGEVTELIPTDDSLLLAYVQRREHGDTTEVSTLAPQIVASLKRERTRGLFEAWQEYLLEEAGFEERADKPIVTDDEEEDARDEPPEEL